MVCTLHLPDALWCDVWGSHGSFVLMEVGWGRQMLVIQSYWCLHPSPPWEPHSLIWGQALEWPVADCFRMEMPSHLKDKQQENSGIVLAPLFLLLQISIVSTFFLFFFFFQERKDEVIYWSKCLAQLSPFIKNYSYYYRNGTQTNRNYPQFSIVKDHSWDWAAEANPQGYWENYIIIYKVC